MASSGTAFFYGWILCAVALLLQMVGTGTLIYCYSVIVLPFEAEFGASRTAMMLGITVLPLAAAAWSPLLGKALDERSLRVFMLIGALALPTGFLLLSTITAIWQMPMIYALLMSYATLMLGPLGASTLLSRWFQDKLALAMGLAALGTSIGGFLFPPLVEWLIDSYGWRAALRALALLAAAITIPAALFIVNRPEDRGLEPYTVDDGRGTKGKRPVESETPPEVMRDRNFWLIVGVLSILFAVYGATLSNLAPFAVDSGADRETAAMLISLLALAGIAGKLGFGAIADRIDLRLALGSAVILIFVGLACYLRNGETMLVAGSVFIGLAAGGMLPVWGAMLAWLFGVRHYGRVMGLMNPFIMPMSILSPAVTGLIYDGTGSYSIAFMLFMGLLVLGVLLVSRIRKQEAAAGSGAARA